MNEREKLIKDLIPLLNRFIFIGAKPGTYPMINAIAEFILADRKRIFEPILNSLNGIKIDENNTSFPCLVESCKEALNLAGLGDEK